MAVRFILACWLIALSGVLQGAAGECILARVAEMPMTFWLDHLFVPVTVNDVAGTFVLDTGAFNSMLDTDFAARAGVAWDRKQPRMMAEGVGGKETRELHAGYIRMLEFGGAKIPDREMPMSDITMPSPKGGHADGLLGADMLNLLDLELDFQAGKATFWRLSGCTDIRPAHWSGDFAAIPLHRQASKHVRIPIWIDGAVIQALLDTGAGGVVLSHAVALQAGATEAELAHDPVAKGMGIGGGATGRRHVFHLLLIGKDVYHDVPAFVTDDTSNDPKLDALVGMAFLRGHRVWLSYGTETLFLQKISDATAK